MSSFIFFINAAYDNPLEGQNFEIQLYKSVKLCI